MLLRRSVAVVAGAFVLSAPAPGDANVLEDVVGFPVKLLLGSTIDKAQGNIDAAVGKALDAADLKLRDHEGRISDLATALLDQGNNAAEARILQVKTGLDDSVARALGQVNGVADELIDRARDELIDRARDDVAGLIQDLDAKVRADLDRVDEIVRTRSADINKLLEDRTTQINHAVEERIVQADEVAKGRLGDVHAIAAQQRIALEGMLARVAVLVGGVVFLVFVMRNLWQRYTDLFKNTTRSERGPQRAAMLVRGLAPALVGPVLAAGCGLLLMGALYRWLPSGAMQEEHDLVAVHQGQLADSVLRIDPPRARFEASHLSYLDPGHAAYYDGQAAKVGLIRDVMVISGLLASEASRESFAQRLSDAERLLGPRPDPDLLTLRAMLTWKTGSTRRAEHEAASLSGRALTLSPRGFALAPLARAYVETFLSQPYIAPDTGEGRDALGLDELSDALALAAPDSPDSSFAGLTTLCRKMRELEEKSTQHYIEMAEANARAVLARDRNDRTRVSRELFQRTEAAKAVVKAWQNFDRALQVDDLVKGRIILNVFGLNDALLTRALWFARRPSELAKRGIPLAKVPKAVERLLLAPARIAWARRYGELLSGPAGSVLQLQEVDQFQNWERWAIELEDALIAEQAAKPSSADELTSGWRVVVAAAALGIYTHVPGPQYRVAYARRRADALMLSSAPAAVAAKAETKPKTKAKTNPEDTAPPTITGAPLTLEDLLGTRGQRLI